MERTLPTIDIHGTTFHVDVAKKELRQIDNSQNSISILDMMEMENHYSFRYDPIEKNIPAFIDTRVETFMVEIPQFVVLDPLGISIHYGRTIEDIKGKSDFDIMVDSEAIAARLSGRLSTLEIDGHLFYVDIPMDCIRPHDDFSNKGIRLTEIEDFLSDETDRYRIPYNLSTHSFEELDIATIRTVRKDIVIIEFPAIRKLDPIGFARKYGLDQRECLRQNGIRKHFQAEKIQWIDTGIFKIIRTNMKNAPQEKLHTGKKKGHNNRP